MNRLPGQNEHSEHSGHPQLTRSAGGPPPGPPAPGARGVVMHFRGSSVPCGTSGDGGMRGNRHWSGLCDPAARE